MRSRSQQALRTLAWISRLLLLKVFKVEVLKVLWQLAR
jgi:hypothetical protein